MRIIVNGETREIPEGVSAAELLELLGVKGKRLALEVNREIVPRSSFDVHRLHSGDRVEIIHAIGGG
jgi:thiamine biosynthesis protein ThiS